MRALVLVCAIAALCAAGCLVDTKATTVSVAYDIKPDSLASVNTLPVTPVAVDLNSVEDFQTRKSDIQDLADLAVVGRLRNNGLTFARVEWWITRDATTFTTAAQVRANGLLLWSGPELLPHTTLDLDWNKSAGLTHPEGRAAIVEEILGDGMFTLYPLCSVNGVGFNVTLFNTSLLMILNSGS